MRELVDLALHNPIKGIAVCIAAAALSLAIGLGIPALSTRIAEQTAVTAIEQSIRELGETSALMSEYSDWFSLGYLQDENGSFTSQLELGSQLVDGQGGAREFLTIAQSPSSVSQRLDNYGLSTTKANEATSIAQTIEDQIRSLVQSRDLAQVELSAALADYDRLRGSLGSVQQKFNEEQPHHVSYHTVPIEETRQLSRQRQQSTEQRAIRLAW
jgi:hypothetical protein